MPAAETPSLEFEEERPHSRGCVFLPIAFSVAYDVGRMGFCLVYLCGY